MRLPRDKYLSSTYAEANPTWDSEDSPWKTTRVAELINAHQLAPGSICEIGCGSGKILAGLRHLYPQTELFGYDIAPAAAAFWADYEKEGIKFQVGDFLELNNLHYDLILLLDVVEHIEDPFSFLIKIRRAAKFFLFHFPLDLCAINILREAPILRQRKVVGHIHYFTKNLALSLLRESGYEIMHWRYSQAAFSSPQRTLRTKLFSLIRFIAYKINKDYSVRALGGETLFVLARPSGDCE
jgi:SAM-dependent methyltransferase